MPVAGLMRHTRPGETRTSGSWLVAERFLLELSPMGSVRNNLIILGLVVVLLGVAAYFIFIREPVSQSTQLGLDLQGGVSAQLRGSQTGGGTVTREEMEQAADLIRQRIDRLGVAEPDVRVQGTNQIVVQIPGVENPDEVIDIIGTHGPAGPLPGARFRPAPQRAGRTRSARSEREIEEDLRDDDAFEEGQTKVIFEESPAHQGGGNDSSPGTSCASSPTSRARRCDQNGASVDFDQATGKRIVTLQLTSEGGQQIAELTQEMINDAQLSGEPALLAIALDEDVQSAPQVNEPLGEQISISNDGLPEGLPEEEARQLETVLNTGALAGEHGDHLPDHRRPEPRASSR